MKTGYGWLVAFVALGGCRHKEEAPMPRRAPESAPSAQADPQFKRLTDAADKAESAGGKLLERTSFYPTQRAQLMKDLAPATDEAKSILGARFAYDPIAPFAERPHRKGWRAIGRVMVWRIEDAMAANKPADAVEAFLAASRFGFGISGGDASDATLGLAIVDEARRSILPALPMMDAKQMSRLSQGLKAALSLRPGPEAVVRNERARSQMFVQALQDATQRGEIGEFERRMGRDGRPAVDHLRAIREETNELRSYFDGLAAEVDARFALEEKLANVPKSERQDEKKNPLEPDLPAERPWRRFIRHFVLTVPAYRAMDDVTVARTRMLIVTAELSRRRKMGQPLPNDLRPFSEGVRTDPYTGHDFVYRTDGAEWTLHSAGEDLTDNGGETDAAGEAPDLILEPQKE
ncbi:hypothetical protein EON79_12345 [bacterium]|nr:MAG: hypothetical protein EON79_12345 [bacterium]